MQCQFCQRIARQLHPSSGYRVPKHYGTRGARSIHLGSWQELQENQSCPTCSLIVVLFKNEFKEKGRDPSWAEYEFGLNDIMMSSTAILNLNSEYYTSNLFFCIDPLEEGLANHNAVVMGQDWLELKRVEEWIRTCDLMHGKCHCQFFGARGLFPIRDMYLISVSNGCLVKANKGDRYIALSYVWGTGMRQFKTLKANLEFLKGKDSLSNTAIRDHIPDTIQRAIHFTSLLGVDLLWVDLLCIVQDDPIQSVAQINEMASIYLNSYLTLCAADGIDADSGLLGVPQSSQPRNIKQDILTFTDGKDSSRWVRRMYGTAVYDERAWTFQEKILSQRILSFTDHGLEWRCQEIVCQEQNTDTRRPMKDYSHLGFTRADILWPNLKKWDNLVSSYLERKLTYEEDILRAFSGVLGALEGGMSGGFHFGLPQLFFDVALLWVPEEQLTRRIDSSDRAARSKFPSWSWAGWKGATANQVNAFGLGHLRSNLLIDYIPRYRDIFSCVTWFKIDMNTLEKSRVPNDYDKYLVGGLEGTVTLPPGWTSYLDHPDGRFYYTYDKAPSSNTFWYPIPTVRSDQPANTRQWGPILSFKTLRGYLAMGDPVPQQEEDEEEDKTIYPLYSLYTEAGEWGGILYVHSPPETNDTAEKKISCELVAISAGFAAENAENDEQADWIPEWNYAKRPRLGDHYTFYHVLWIEWRDGIAYRRGLGRVVGGVWGRLPKDEVEILLG